MVSGRAGAVTVWPTAVIDAAVPVPTGSAMAVDAIDVLEDAVS